MLLNRKQVRLVLSLALGDNESADLFLALVNLTQKDIHWLLTQGCMKQLIEYYTITPVKI